MFLLFKKMRLIVENIFDDQAAQDPFENKLKDSQDPTTDPDRLHSLSGERDPEISKNIVSNPNAGLSARLHALRFYPEHVPHFLNNPALDLDMMENDPFGNMEDTPLHQEGLKALATHPQTSPFIQEKLLNHQSQYNADAIRDGLSENPNLHPQIADTMYKEINPGAGHYSVLKNLLKHPNLPHGNIRAGLTQGISDLVNGHEPPHILATDHPEVHSFLDKHFDSFHGSVSKDASAIIANTVLKNPNLSSNIIHNLSKKLITKNYRDSDGYLDQAMAIINHKNTSPETLHSMLDKALVKGNSDRSQMVHALLDNSNFSRSSLEKLSHLPKIPTSWQEKIMNHPNVDDEIINNL